MSIQFGNVNAGNIQIQNVAENAQGTQTMNVGGDSAETLERKILNLLAREVSPEELQAAEPIVRELKDAAEAGTLKRETQPRWTHRLAEALAMGANIVKITEAPWWGSVLALVARFFV